MTDFKPGLEGVVAFETEIAEPDRDGGALRYRGVDIEELVGSVPFEKVWGLLVDEAPEPGLPPAEEYVPRDLTGRTPSDLQSVTARLGGEWGLGQLIDISDGDAKEDLRRLSATMISVCAQSARLADGHTDRVRCGSRRPGRDDRRAVPARVARRGRSEGRPGDRHLLDLHRRARAQRLDVHGAHRRLDGRRLRRGALVGGRRALGPAPRRRAGARAADARRRRGRVLHRGVRQGPARPRRAADGLRSPRLPGRGPAGAPAPSHGAGARVAAVRGRGGARARRARGAPRPQARPRARDERRVLVGCRARRRGRAAAARAGDVRLLAHGRLVGARPRAEAPRPAGPSVGPIRRAGRPLALQPSKRGGARGGRSARRGARPGSRERAGARHAPQRSGTTRSRRRRATPTTASAARRTGRSRSSASGRSSSSSAEGSRTRARARAAPRSSR